MEMSPLFAEDLSVFKLNRGQKIFIINILSDTKDIHVIRVRIIH